MELNTTSHQLQEAWEKHRVTSPSNLSWRKAQQDAYTRLQQGGLPTNKSEDYKYTPLTRALSEKFDLRYAPSQEDYKQGNITQDIKQLLPSSLNPYPIVLINGVMHPLAQPISDHKEELPFELYSFSAAHPKHQNLLNDYFAQSISQTDPFALLNTAFFPDGVLIYVPDDTVIAAPICMYNIAKSATTTAQVSHLRILLYIGKNSQVSLINSWHSDAVNPVFTNAVIDVHVGAQAQFNYYNLQIHDQSAYQVVSTNCYQEEYSQANSYAFAWEGALIRNNLSFYLQASYAKSKMYGLYYPTGKQHIDNHTTVDHQQPNTESQELYKGIVDEEATGVFNGKIYVQAAAQKTLAFQANNNILLSDTATIHTKPQLEIWADDVKCSHGATVGQLDENQLFYLQARGIPYEVGKHMLLHAFAAEVIEKVPLLSLRDYLKDTFATKLKQLD
jgi:Fe-S cluster assembly protein SufD